MSVWAGMVWGCSALPVLPPLTLGVVAVPGLAERIVEIWTAPAAATAAACAQLSGHGRAIALVIPSATLTTAAAMANALFFWNAPARVVVMFPRAPIHDVAAVRAACWWARPAISAVI